MLNENIFRVNYPYTLSKMTAEDWTYVQSSKGTCQIITEDLRLEQAIRYPGFLLDSHRPEEFSKFYEQYLKFDDLTIPRGNLSSKFITSSGNPLIVCGIAPGFSTYSSSEPKWLLGPSSKILHKMLYRLGICPYFTNIHKKSFEANNTDGADPIILNQAFKFLKLELETLYVSFFKKCNKIFILSLGKYKEYDKFRFFLAKNNKVLHDKIEFVSTYHPAYYLRNGIHSVDNEIILKEITRLNEIFMKG